MERQLTLFPASRPLVERLGVEFFRQVPETPGVYLMCGAGSGVLYVGKAKNLRQRLSHYRSANLERLPRKLRRLLCAVERIEWDECADETSALARERELLRALQPRFNTVGVRPARKDWVGWRRTEFGLRLACGEWSEGWEGSTEAFPMGRWLYAALLRSLWWTLHSSVGWEQMPRPLQSGRTPSTWEFQLNAEQAEEVRRCLAALFAGESPELIEWCVGTAAMRPSFERAWVEQDAAWLLESFERIQSAASAKDFPSIP